MMKFLKKRKIIVCLTLIFFLYLCITASVSAKYQLNKKTACKVAADTIIYKPSFDYKFAKAKPNIIVDSDSSLYCFFEKLSCLRKLSNDSIRTVSVVHIGDSHIQADFFTGTVRKLMNHYFGNPGRGLIAPNRLMKSNNGRHYKITSSNQWQHSFVVKPNDIPIGVTGLGLQTKNTTANINILTVDESFPGEWDFSKITAYCNLEKAEICLLHPGVTGMDTVNPFAKAFLLDSLTNNVEIRFISPEKEISVSGFHLSNGKRGVFYHSIGINGARFDSYNQCSEDFYQQIASLEPDLVIISLGTNEAMIKTIDEDQLYSDISDFVFNIRHSSPNTVVIFTTPVETFAKAGRKIPTVPNHKIGKVRDIIVSFAGRNKYPCWDLYEIAGGKGSALEWNKKQLFVRDRIHLTQRGYEYQGELLFEAIMKSYNQYIKANI
ncbi:MAG: GDSL-type esterase/lipase family protein [Prevotellaceae bacterium]|jgi:lysophospholipase L1-like esterase|nr:GDSL-type esterase/lipase family protein [Prevotellaceae bacterium]